MNSLLSSKSIVLTLILTGVIISANAQVKFDVKFGLNVANQRVVVRDHFFLYPISDDDFLFDPSTNPYIGVSCDLPIVKAVSLRTELSYLGTGYSGTTNDNIFFPLSIQYHVNDQFSLLAGGYVSYLFNSPKALDENTERIDFGPRFGAEYVLKKGAGLGIQYCWGVFDVYKGENYFSLDGSGELDAYNRGLQIYLLYKFSLKKPSEEK